MIRDTLVPSAQLSMEFDKMLSTVRNNVTRVAKIERKVWGPEVCVTELTKQVGELAKNVLLVEGYYHEADANREDEYRTAVGDELADILYMVIRMSDHYGIDLLKAHIAARDREDKFLTKRGL